MRIAIDNKRERKRKEKWKKVKLKTDWQDAQQSSCLVSLKQKNS